MIPFCYFPEESLFAQNGLSIIAVLSDGLDRGAYYQNWWNSGVWGGIIGDQLTEPFILPNWLRYEGRTFFFAEVLFNLLALDYFLPGYLILQWFTHIGNVRVFVSSKSTNVTANISTGMLSEAYVVFAREPSIVC